MNVAAKKKSTTRILAVAVTITILLIIATTLRPRITLNTIEQAHGVTVPPSATNFQQRQLGIALLDHGILSLFELSTADTEIFLKQLNVKAKHSSISTVGDPLEAGWNVWPPNAETFVPGNTSLSAGLKQTWSGRAEPIQMFSCQPPKGDWLHVEIWAIPNGRLIKMYTDWN